MQTDWNSAIGSFDKKTEPEKSPESKGIDSMANKIEGILNDFANGGMDKDQLVKMLVSDRINFAYERLQNFCLIAQNLRNCQKQYFATRDTKVLKEAQRLEIDFDKRLDTFQKLMSENQKAQ